jgi:hypothetical protein
MIKNAAKLLATGIAVAALVTVAFVDPATAQEQEQRQRMINLAESQNMLVQRMSKELILVALDIDKNNNLRSLESSRALFERTLKALRDGDSGLGSPGSRNPDFLEGLGKVGELWLLYDATIRRSTKTQTITADQKQLISMLDTTIELLAHQGALTQQMSKEFLLIAYGHEADKNRKALKDSMALFDQTLDGLLNGNPEQQLLPAPNAEITAQLRMVARMWDEFRPLLSVGARGSGIDRGSITKVAEVNGPLLDAISEAIAMYENL